ncbi:toll/interleukin-1 receptor domain-containing protein [Microbispora cellulosiformans]|uniref:Toll/interleukin-1 receptor domain-containing protein n=1 Tax=Microbispora cellulosiformans TaxID=2614688 RepID=A0A5J5JYK8_9ACTN|nr:toll/interleukin-1 receptor domain-containing protein [Microbispora cellulosiformans]KAA9375454.1 toll/interleukin-1 receptor domain-containing protein [Microbispora cellulosiformans]
MKKEQPAMPDVFVNYRNGDGDKTATFIERELSHRFGDEAAFRASKSIAPGTRYQEELLHSVRRSEVLLAVIGPNWTNYPALYDENDWVRREILEAFECGISVIPVLEGTETARLKAADLPQELRPLADRQSVRLDMKDPEPGLTKITKRLIELVPTLHDRTTPEPESSVRNQMGNVSGRTNVQGRDIAGGIGNDYRQVHLGRGNINNQQFSGPGAMFVGENNGGIHQRFNGQVGDEDEDR